MSLSFEELLELNVDRVYSASKYEQSVSRAPASVSIVTSDDIRKLGLRTLAGVLQSVRGVYVPYDRTYSYLGIRGFQRPGDFNSRVLLLVDGHRLNENLYGAFLLGTEAVPDVDLIDRVEVIRGPSSSLYGESAFLGVVNVITKRGRQLNGFEVSGEVASFDTYYGRLSFGQKFDNETEVLLSASWYDSAGHESLYYPEFDQRISTNRFAANNGWAENADRDQAAKLFASVSYGDFSFAGAFSDRQKHMPTACFDAVFNDDRLVANDRWGYAELKYQHEFETDTALSARASYDHYAYLATYPSDYAEPGEPPFPVLNRDDNDGDWFYAEGQLTQKIRERHTLVFGLDYRNNFRQYELNYDVEPYAVNGEIDTTSWNLGVYGQAEVAFLTNLTLNAGLRYDYYDSFQGTVNPRAGLMYSPWTPTTFKLLYGQAFRAPNRYELYYNSGLDPETIRTYEVVYEQSLLAHLRLLVSGYYYEIDDLIASTEDVYGYRNLNEARAGGVELELDGRFPGGWTGQLGYSLQRAEDAQSGDELSNSPRHLLRLNLIAPLYRDRLFAGLQLRYMSGVETLAGHETDDFAIVNLTLFSQKLLKGLEVSATIYNLLDTEYAYPAGAGYAQDTIEQDGRNLRVKLTYRF